MGCNWATRVAWTGRNPANRFFTQPTGTPTCLLLFALHHPEIPRIISNTAFHFSHTLNFPLPTRELVMRIIYSRPVAAQSLSAPRHLQPDPPELPSLPPALQGTLGDELVNEAHRAHDALMHERCMSAVSEHERDAVALALPAPDYPGTVLPLLAFPATSRTPQRTLMSA